MSSDPELIDPLLTASGIVVLGEDTESDDSQSAELSDDETNKSKNISKAEVFERDTDITSGKSNFLTSLSSAFGLSLQSDNTGVNIDKLRSANAHAWTQKTQLESDFVHNGNTCINKLSRNYDTSQQLTIRCSNNIRQTTSLVTDTVASIDNIITDSHNILRLKPK